MSITIKIARFALLFSLLFALKATGQSTYKIEYYSTEQGLSHQRVTSLLKDREGFMWFGSWDGINRFDGHSFVSFKSSSGDRSQLGNDRIDQIVEDQSGHFWLRAYDRQIYRFDKAKRQFLPLSAIASSDLQKKNTFYKILSAHNGWVWMQSDSNGLFCISQTDWSKERMIWYQKGQTGDYQIPSNTINIFHEDLEHHIWIGTPDGFCCLEAAASGVYKNSKIVPPGIAAGVNLTSIDEDSERLYFGTTDGNIIIYNKRSRSFSTHKIISGRVNAILRSKQTDIIYISTSTGALITFHLKDLKYTSVSFRSGESLHSLYEDGKGCLWIEPDKLGAIRFDPSSQSFRYFSQINGERLNYIGNRYRILEDNNGIVWVNMKGGGFGHYDPMNEDINYFINTPDAGKHRLPNIVYSIYYDQAGILWLTTNERELIRIVLQGNEFKHQLLDERGLSKSDNEVRGVFYDNKNRLWLGAKRGDLFIYQDHRQIKDLFVNMPAQGLAGVYAIIQDRLGNIWLGTKGNGLFKATPVNKEETKYRLTHFKTDKSNSKSLPCNEIYSLLEDKQGRIWIGSFDAGLFLLECEKDSIKFIHTGNAFKNYPKEGFNKIRHMATDEAGNIWIGTTNGLLLLDADTKHSPVFSYAVYSKIPGDQESLGNNDVQFIYRDSKNRMWVATSGGGFCQAIGNTPLQSLKFRNYTTREGLPNDYVLSCVEDKNRNIWIATEKGLSKFTPEQKLFRNYDSYDGLPKVGFSEAAVCNRTSDGQLVFGITKGYLSFEPDRISTNRINTNIALINLQINNQDAGPGMNETVLMKDINYVSELTLQYNQNIISIDYAILDHRAGNRQDFAYRLVGFDTTWHDDRQQRRATYTNLPPGRYVFEVKSLSTDLYTN